MTRLFLTIVMTLTLISSELLAENMEMICKHSFQGNYSGGDTLLRYEHRPMADDSAYIYSKSGWIEICTDVETHGSILVENYRARCSIYLPNWMNQRRKDFVWDFTIKELHVQTLSKILNPSTNEKEWQWRFGVGQIGSKDRKYFSVWESDGIEYKKRKCK